MMDCEWKPSVETTWLRSSSWGDHKIGWCQREQTSLVQTQLQEDSMLFITVRWSRNWSGLVWSEITYPHPTTTFRSDCWNPLQTELNYLWWVLSCSQDDIIWLYMFSDVLSCFPMFSAVLERLWITTPRAEFFFRVPSIDLIYSIEILRCV